jgi:hypothetical protein
VPEFEGWTEAASEPFQASMHAVVSELYDLADVLETKAKIVSIMAELITALRDIIRDLIAQLVGSLLCSAVLAASMATQTRGASIPAFISFAVGKAVALGTNIATRVARVVAALARQIARIGQLDDIAAKIGKGWDRFENAPDGSISLTHE